MGLDERLEAADCWHRVHWIRLVELLGRAVIASVILFGTGMPNGLGSWAEELFGLAMGLAAVANYFSTRYRITADAVTTTKGVLFRSEETLQRADIQTVTEKHPIWFRPFGLVVVQIADDAGNEIDVGPVTSPVAGTFAEALRSGVTDVGRASPGRVGDRHARPGGATIFADDPPLRAGPADTAPAGLLGVQSAASANPNLGARPDEPDCPSLSRRLQLPMWKLLVISTVDLGLLITLIAIGLTAYFGLWVVAISVTLAAAPIPIFEVVSVRRFRLTIVGDEIRVRDGILTVSESRTTLDRSQFLRIDEPWAFRLLHLERVSLGNGDDVVLVAPAQPRGEWRRFPEQLLAIGPFDDVPVTPINARSVSRFRLRGAVAAIAVGLLASAVDWRLGLGTGVVTAAVAAGWYPDARLARYGLASTVDTVKSTTSFAPRRTWLHRLDRIDASTLTSTPSQRRRALVTLRFSGRSPASEVRIPDLDAEVATGWERMIATKRIGVADSSPVARPLQPVDVERRDVRLPRAAVGAALAGKAPWAVLQLAGWTALMVGVRLSDPPSSAWRSPWLLSVGTALVLASATATLVLAVSRARVTRWSLTERHVERRSGVATRRIVTLDRSRIAAAKWSQGPVERRFGLGSVTLLSSGVSNPNLVLHHLAASDARALADLHRPIRVDTQASSAPT